MPATRADEWIGVLDITIPKYLKKVEDGTIRARWLLAFMEDAGRILFDQESTDLIWDVQFAEPPVRQYATGVVNYEAHNLYKQAAIDLRGYLATDLMDHRDKLMNKGTSAIVNRYEKILPNLMRAIRNRFSTELYVDGYAAGNELAICGFESWCGDAVTPAADDWVVAPSDSYAQLSTALAQSGTWDSSLSDQPTGTQLATVSDWPEGKGDAEYDYFSPKLLKWNSTYWTGQTTFEANCERVISRAHQYLSLTGGAEGPPNSCLLQGSMLSSFKDALRADRMIPVVDQKSADMGFADTLLYEGMRVRTEFGVPANTGYIFRVEDLEILCPETQLFVPNGPHFDPDSFAYKFAVACFCNLRIKSPKYFAKLGVFA